jgi:hypothetical protein
MGRRITLLVEGKSECGDARRRTLPDYLKRWLDPQLPFDRRVGIAAICLGGVDRYLNDYAQKAHDQLERGSDYVIGLVDAREFPFARLKIDVGQSRDKSLAIAKAQIEAGIDARFSGRFRQHFVVQELESLLLADDQLWEEDQLRRIRKAANSPHAIPNAAELVAALRGSHAKKVISALHLFPRSNLANALRHRCEHLAAFAADLATLGKELSERG